ncbi:hypothetical protein K7432_010073 [Basidiobolus ranarum]|uniref:MPN domain-containing protein n=1 Tax=Basidiobolus ranarum TaxID=34480 RepID=A0ABR2WPB8_9FUNG
MQVVGWYHSHPTFAPDPSLVDMENQRNYQHLFRHEGSEDEPFVGAIVGPYDPRLPGSSSVINWFYSSTYADERGHPKRLIFDLVENSDLPSIQADEWLKLISEYQVSPEKVCLSDSWRPGHSETKLEKMVNSLAGRMPWLRVEPSETPDNQDSEDKQEVLPPIQESLPPMQPDTPIDVAPNPPATNETLVTNEEKPPSASELDSVTQSDSESDQDQTEFSANSTQSSLLEAQCPVVDLEKQKEDYFLSKLVDQLQNW